MRWVLVGRLSAGIFVAMMKLSKKVSSTGYRIRSITLNSGSWSHNCLARTIRRLEVISKRMDLIIWEY